MAVGKAPEGRREVPLFDYGKGFGDGAVRVRAALGFCNLYKLAMSNLGFQWIYHLLNLEPDVYCDRFYLPDDAEDLRDSGKAAKPLSTFENRAPLNRFDLLGFSIPFEPDYLNLAWMLKAGGVEPLAERRAGRGGPIVIAGGVAVSSNPEPIADFVDLFFIGEAERSLRGFLDGFLNVRETSGLKPYEPGFRERLFDAVKTVNGVYVPSRYRVAYAPDGVLVRHEAMDGHPEKAANVMESDLASPAHSAFLCEEAVFGNMFLVEISRGCPYGCKFCWTRSGSRKFRAGRLEGLEPVIDFGLERCERIGLIGVSFFNMADLETICRRTFDRGGTVSFSSIRFTKRVMDAFVRLGGRMNMESLAIAPEAATERLRKVVNKEFELGVEENLYNLNLPGLKRVKMYFLAGIPGETLDDALEIARMARRVAENMSERNVTVGVGVNPLIPKPATPFQWLSYPGRADLERKFRLIRDEARRDARVEVKTKSEREGRLQAVLARGDRRLSAPLLEHAPGDNAAAFFKAMKRNGLDPAFYLRAKGREELFPWDVIDHRMSKDRLYREYEAALDEAGATAPVS